VAARGGDVGSAAKRDPLEHGLGFDVYGLVGRASFDPRRPAEYLFDDTQPEARTRGVRQVIVGPQMPSICPSPHRPDGHCRS
jgi:hypothetical protein